MFVIEKENAENELRVCLFKAMCSQHGVPCRTVALPEEVIPQNISARAREFYSKFAPVDITIEALHVRFLPYYEVFDIIREHSGIIPIALYKEQQIVYIDMYPDGTWDDRVQLEIGDGRVEVLGTDIFDYLSNLAKRIGDEIP